MKHPPYIKKIFFFFFCDKVTVNIYYSMQCAQCVMVAKTALHCVMGCKIAQMWQLAGHRPTEKSDRKVFILQKEVCRPYNFCSLYDRPTLCN